MNTHPSSDEFAPEPIDVTRRFVRVRGERGNGFVEFEFAIGEPELFVEMVLNRAAFAEFCADNRVQMLDPAAAHTGTPDWEWSLHDATHARFRQDP